MAKLITRFYDPDSGQILIDGQDLSTLQLDSLRRQFGYVPQEPFLFAGTIRDNIAFARPEATDEEVIQACKAVGIDELIDQMPEGIHSPVHERGSSLSSGERQLLALARAFLARPRIILLDEATSNLDMASESKIQHALGVLLKDRTAIIIAHRLSTAQKADRIALFHQGKLVELGSHQQLLEQNGRYARMYHIWEELD
jgi:ATP-binding cassette subfamily B protein